MAFINIFLPETQTNNTTFLSPLWRHPCGSSPELVLCCLETLSYLDLTSKLDSPKIEKQTMRKAKVKHHAHLKPVPEPKFVAVRRTGFWIVVLPSPGSSVCASKTLNFASSVLIVSLTRLVKNLYPNCIPIKLILTIFSVWMWPLPKRLAVNKRRTKWKWTRWLRCCAALTRTSFMIKNFFFSVQ